MLHTCTGGEAGAQSLDWDAASEWVLGCRQDVWQAVFEAAFLQRGKALIAAAFAEVHTLKGCMIE